MTRKKIFIQVYDENTCRSKSRWINYRGFNTYDEAVNELNALQKKYPDAKIRVLDNNLITHTK